MENGRRELKKEWRRMGGCSSKAGERWKQSQPRREIEKVRRKLKKDSRRSSALQRGHGEVMLRLGGQKGRIFLQLFLLSFYPSRYPSFSFDVFPLIEGNRKYNLFFSKGKINLHFFLKTSGFTHNTTINKYKAYHMKRQSNMFVDVDATAFHFMWYFPNMPLMHYHVIRVV